MELLENAQFKLAYFFYIFAFPWAKRLKSMKSLGKIEHFYNKFIEIQSGNNDVLTSWNHTFVTHSKWHKLTCVIRTVNRKWLLCFIRFVWMPIHTTHVPSKCIHIGNCFYFGTLHMQSTKRKKERKKQIVNTQIFHRCNNSICACVCAKVVKKNSEFYLILIFI